MNREKIKQIVSDAFDVEPAGREAFVRNACGGDEVMLGEALSLLDAASHVEANGFLASDLDLRGAVKTAMPAERGKTSVVDEPQQFGRYRVLECIGEGGMGIVYRAEQRVPMRREVVVKVIKLGMDTKLVIARFEAERQALAMMDHPHIAKVYDAGSDTNGRPYFVMEYVKGTPIVDYADRNQLSIKERLELFLQVCQAIQHAHHKGIIHRDIKPNNVLVSTQDGKAFAKVIDFGIAKATNQRLTDRTLFTEHVNMIGTPAYMSPEQADGNIDIDTRTDVYSLGVVLYELLTGNTPFDAHRLKSAAINEIARIIREEDPPKPSTMVNTLVVRAPSEKKSAAELKKSRDMTLASLAKSRSATTEAFVKSLRGEVDWIVMKALEKTRARRYDTPTALAEDIERCLEGLPILAAPPTLIYRAQKFSARYRAALATAVVIVFLLLVAAIGTSFGLVKARSALRDAELSRGQALLAGQAASDQAKIAIAAKEEADAQANLAKKSALLAQARYLIQQAQLPEAMNQLTQANQLGLTMDDRLALNEFFKASRKKWNLLARIPTATRPTAACIVNTQNDGEFVCGTNGARVFVQRISDNVPMETANLDARPFKILAFKKVANQFIAVTANRVNLFQVQPLVKLKTRTFNSPINLVETSPSSVLVTLNDGTICLLNGQTLEDVQTWKWDDVADALANGSQPRVIGISSDDRFVILHALSWNTPTTVIDRVQKKTFTCVLRVGQIGFSERNPERCVTWFAPGLSGGLTDELCTYDLENSGNQLEMHRLNNENSKEPMEFRLVDGRLKLFGAVGAVERDEYQDGTGVRYQSMWPFAGDNPEFLSTDIEGSTIALSGPHDLLVFTMRRNSVIEAYINNYASCATDDGVFFHNIDDDNARLQMLHYQPFGVNSNSVDYPIQLLKRGPGLTWYPWGMHATRDGKHFAMLEQGSAGLDTVSDQYGKKEILLYDLSAGLDRAESWTIKKQIEIVDQVGVSGFRNRMIRLSPGGESVIFGSSIGEVERFDCATGEARESWQFQSSYEASPDGMYVGGIQDSGADWVVYRVADGSVAVTIKNIGRTPGGCFSDDKKSLLLSRGGQEIEAFDLATGKSMWARESTLIPRAWCVATHRFMGMMAEKSGSGSKLMLADIDTGQAVASVSEFGEHHNDVSFARNGSVLYFQRDRWDFEITRLLQMSDLTLGMKTAPVITPDESASLAPVPVVISELMRTAVDASDLTKLPPLLSKEIALVGEVMKVSPTATGGHLNILLDPEKSGVMLFLRSKYLRLFNDSAGGDFGSAVLGKKVLVRGTLGSYGGRAQAMKERYQIELVDPAQVQIIESNPSSKPSTTP